VTKEAVVTMLRKLRLSGAVQTLAVRLEEARGHKLGAEEFLERCSRTSSTSAGSG
jgi:hypothetical protein